MVGRVTVEYADVNVMLKVIKCEKHLFIQSTDNVGLLFTLPIVAINTRLTNRRVSMRANGLMLKAAFIHINDGIALVHEAIKFALILRSFYQKGFWILQGLFFD